MHIKALLCVQVLWHIHYGNSTHILCFCLCFKIRRSLLNEDEYGFRRAKRPIYYDEGLEVMVTLATFMLWLHTTFWSFWCWNSENPADLKWKNQPTQLCYRQCVIPFERRQQPTPGACWEWCWRSCIVRSGCCMFDLSSFKSWFVEHVMNGCLQGITITCLSALRIILKFLSNADWWDMLCGCN